MSHTMRALARTLAVTACLVLLGCSGSGVVPDSGPVDPAPGANPASLPLLASGQRVGVIYSTPAPAARTVMDAAWGECLSRGADCYQLAVRWTDIETSPGLIDTTFVDNLLATIQLANLTPYLVVKTIDTTGLNLPSDLVDPGNSNELAPGLLFDSPTVLQRFAAVIDQLVPVLVARGGFYLSVGNEADIWLASRPQHVTGFANFVSAARTRAHGIEPELAVGVTVTFAAIANSSSTLTALDNASDVLAWTYYPLNGDFTVRPPSEVPGDFALMRAANGSKPLLLQEVGYPSGYVGLPGNGSSEELQRQFVAAVFAELRADAGIRLCSFLHLGDYSPADLDEFEIYYGSSLPRFREFLGTLGMRAHADGAPKSAYAEFLAGLDGM